MERWRQIDAILKSALELPAGERARFLDQACAEDESLRRDVESLIAHDQTEGFLKSPAADDAARLLAADWSEPLVGQLVGHYRILEQIGAGGMGEVYLAQDTRMERQVALKLLPAYFTKDEGRVRRFQQEARAVLALNHPNIITIYEIGQAAGAYFIATEFIKGETLREHLAGVETPQALDIAIQTAGALSAAHEAGIVHRDIKPENIMLRRDGYIKVLDFGLAKLIENADRRTIDSQAATRALVKTDAGVIMGTASYMSPEQARGLPVDARTDIWSLGVVLYEMAAGRRPFEGETNSDIVSAILSREPPPLARYAPDAPPELQRIIRKALEKDREERYQTIKDLLIDLKNLRRGLEVEAELQRSAPPAFSESGPQTSGGRRQTADETVGARASGTAATQAAPSTISSAEYLVGEIRRHKTGAFIALAAFVLTAASLAYFFSGRFGGGGQTIDSIAVLPFVNASAEPRMEYLSDGITESLINSLSQLPALKVMSRNSVFSYKGRETDAREAANQLGVRAVLTGRVTQRGDSLLVSVELVDARDNSHVWGDQYNRKFSDVFAVQQEIARDISARLRSRLTGEQMRRVTKNHTDNVEAYQFYLKGLHELDLHTPPSLKASIEYYNRAITLDPTYALAYAGLAHAYGSLANMDGGLPPNEAYLKAKQAAERAVELDDSLAEGHVAIAFVKTFYEWDWEGARREALRAIELNPNSESAHALYADYLRIVGRLEESLIEAQREQELDPLHPFTNTHVCIGYYLLGRHDEAIAQCKRALDLDPKFPVAHYALGTAYEGKGKYAEAVAAFENATKVTGRTPSFVALLGHTYAVSGRRTEALKALDEMKMMSDRRPISPYWFALLYTGLGDKEQAFAWLEKAYAERFFYVRTLKVDPRFASLRSDPRFADLTRRMGLP